MAGRTVGGAGRSGFAPLRAPWRNCPLRSGARRAPGGGHLTPSPHHAGAPVPGEAAGDRGPVMISLEYYIDRANAAAYHAAAREMRRVRRRGGAPSWSLFEDMDEPGCYVETFVIESWLEHRRQHERFSVNDKAIQARVHALHLGPEAPRVRHSCPRLSARTAGAEA
ncbi:MFS transporter [Cupriavidus basilensis]|uniref:MFS transporter n=1 Tax=Cupriavidus basilensis TaxID=68895 RepID=UPI003464E225